MDKIVAQFGRNVAAARRRANLTQEELHALSGIHPTEVSRIERGQRDVRISTVRRLAKALGLSAGQLLEAPSDERA